MKKCPGFFQKSLLWLFGFGFLFLAGVSVWLAKKNQPYNVSVGFNVTREKIAEHTHYDKFLYPVVGVVKDGVGSGVVLYSDLRGQEIETYILSAAHLFDIGNTDKGVAIISYDYNTPNFSISHAEVVAIDGGADLSLIKIITKGKWKTAVLGGADFRPLIFEPVYAVGGSLGLKPRPTSGEITDTADDKTWEINAPILPGNSGGGCFTLDGSLVGITVRVRCLVLGLPGGTRRPWLPINEMHLSDKPVSPHTIIPIETMGGIVSLKQIHKFLNDNGYGFITKK